jgi:lipoprotein NlpD
MIVRQIYLHEYADIHFQASHFTPHYVPMRKLLLISFILLLAACSSRYSAPVDQIGDGPRFLGDGRVHRVNGGETLYAIAWMYDLDVNVLARVNNLPAPYTVYPGQTLSVDLRSQPGGGAAPRATLPRTATASAATSTGAVDISRPSRGAIPAGGSASGTTRTTLPPSSDSQNTPVSPVTTPITREPISAATTARVETAPPALDIPLPAPQEQAPAQPTISNGDINWGWPHNGTLIGRFSDNNLVGKGVDIAGREGDPVVAAAEGEVVYAGGGLQRYGNLIILKHNDHFLSAYAHNRALMVREGQQVGKGEQIAELGSSGVDRNMLHFEIREDGRPVDPAIYLPVR